jgi:tRNA pseudouridine synthase A
MGKNGKKENLVETNVEEINTEVEKSEEQSEEVETNVEEQSEEINTENKITKKDLEDRIKKGDFRIVRNFVFKDGSKELRVDYKDTDRNYLLEENKLIEYFKEKYPHQEFFILGE